MCKRILSSALVIIFVLLSFNLTVFAHGFSAVFSSAAGKPGETVEIKLSLTNDQPVKSLAYTDLDFDAEALTFVQGDWNVDGAIINSAKSEEGVMAKTESSVISGEILTLKFEINKDASGGEYKIKANINANGKALSAIASPGTITVNAENKNPQPSFKGQFENVSGKSGDKIEIKLNLINESAVKSIAYTDLKFDSDVLTFIKGEWNVENATMCPANASEGAVAIQEAKVLSGEILTLVFKINENVSSGDYYVTANISADGNKLKSDGVTCKVNVETSVPWGVFSGVFLNTGGYPGDMVNVVMQLSNENSIKSLAYMNLTFDKNALTFIKGSWNIENAVIEAANESEGAVAVSEAQILLGNVLTLTFKINDNASEGAYEINADLSTGGNKLIAKIDTATVTVYPEIKERGPELPDPTVELDPQSVKIGYDSFTYVFNIEKDETQKMTGYTLTVNDRNNKELANGTFSANYTDKGEKKITVTIDSKKDMPKLVIEPGKSYHYTFTVTIDGKEYKMMSVFTTNAKPVDPGPGDNSGKDNPSVLYGDITGDGEIDILDVITLRRYLAKWNVKIVDANADVNKDGEIDILDVIKLRRYLANWNVVLGE
ncbi:MAG: hypothetical protein IJK23_10775 [Clostridia bacterium]|nr:hypothetical protein [Clostridia bacterium]